MTPRPAVPPIRSTSLRSRVLILAIAVALTGCGSTALRGSAVGRGSSGPTGAAATTTGTLPGAVGTTTSGAELQGGAAAGSSGVLGTPGGRQAAGSTGARPGSPAGAGSSGGGMSGAAAADRTPIKLGVVGTDVGAIAAVFGKPGIDWTTSPKKVVDHINKSGGVGGRQLVPTFFGADSAADNATNGQKACSAMTEDNNIDVVVNVGMLGDVLPACLKQRGVAMFDAASWYADATVMDQFPNWVIPNAIRLDRSAGALMQTAVSRGFMKRGAKLGVIVEGCPWGQRVYNGTVVPLAQRSGVTVVEGSTKCITNLVADLVPVQNDVQREALRLKTLGATHVMVLSQAEAFVFAQFTGQASQQRYFPKYLVSSQAYPTQNSTEGAVIAISADARANVLGVGTMPYLDTGDAAAVVRGAQVSRDRCSKADPERQQAETNAFALNNFYGMCDTFYAMKLAIEASGLHTGAADVVRGWAAVLQRKASSSILAGGVWSGSGAGRLDGAGYARPFAYDTGKKRFAYVGAAVAVP